MFASAALLALMSAHKNRAAVRVVKNSKESNEKLISRFQKKVQGSRVIVQAKEHRYYKKPLKKKHIRARAIMRDHYRALREKQRYL